MAETWGRGDASGDQLEGGRVMKKRFNFILWALGSEMIRFAFGEMTGCGVEKLRGDQERQYVTRSELQMTL